MDIKKYKQQLLDQYNQENPQSLNEGFTIKKISKNINCIVTNMTFDEYVKKTGYKTYEEIKKELGL